MMQMNACNCGNNGLGALTYCGDGITAFDTSVNYFVNPCDGKNVKATNSPSLYSEIAPAIQSSTPYVVGAIALIALFILMKK